MDYGEAGPSVAVYGQDEPHSDAEEPIDQTDDSAGIKHDSLSSTRQLYVCNIARKTSKDLFDMYFSKYGEITYSFIPLDKISGRSRGFGFVTFASAEVADKVLQEEHVIDGRAVHVKRLAPRWQGRGGVSRRIFVGGLPSSINEDDLRDYFSSYGNIVEHKIIFDNITKESMGYGFVTFENEDAVEKILSDDRMHELGGNQVDIRKAEPRKRFHHGRSSRRSSGNFAGGSDGFGGGYGGQMGRGGYGSYGSYGGYSGYGNFPGYYHAGYGYGYGYGFGGTMYGGGFYGGPTGYGQGYSVYDAGAISYGPYYGEQGGRHNAGATSYGQDDGRQGGGYDTGATAYGQDEGG